MNIFECKDVKSYLKLHLSRLPKRGRGEINKMAAHLEVSSTLVSHVMSGQKNLSLEQAHQLTEYLGLIDIEADYFMALNHLERAGTHKYKNYWRNKLKLLKEQSLKLSERLKQNKTLSEEDKAIFYSSSLYVCLRLYTTVSEQGQTLQALANRFNLELSKCAEMMMFLVRSGFCYEKSGFYFTSIQGIHLEKGSPHLLRFQTDWRLKALQTAENLSEEELLFTGPVTLSKTDFKYLREEIIQFIKTFLKVVHDSPAEELACLNIDWFWVK